MLTWGTNIANITKYKWNHANSILSCSCSNFPFLNSFILHRYSACTSKILTYLEYHVELAKLLIGNYCSRKRPGRPLTSSTPPAKRNSVPHFPVKVSSGRCMCSAQSRNSRISRLRCAFLESRNGVPISRLRIGFMQSQDRAAPVCNLDSAFLLRAQLNPSSFHRI